MHMDKKQKTDNFINAIKKYADKKHDEMRNEVELIKSEKLNEAEEKAKYECEKLIKDKLEAKKNEETSKIAKLIQDGQKELFLMRAKMTDSIFEKAAEKLIEFTKTQTYSELLINSAKEIADFFDCESCVLYINEKDMDSADRIKALFKGDAQVVSDKTVKIGGIKGFCETKNIVADNTLDSKLYAQREWFIQNSDLSIL